MNPKYLDPQGLVALWRESLLAQAVLRGETRGYRNHPQLDRFKQQAAPLSAMSLYLKVIQVEAESRGYCFDKSKIRPTRKQVVFDVSDAQVEYEWEHLMSKLKARSPVLYRQWRKVASPEPHPMFRVYAGKIESWERP